MSDIAEYLAQLAVLDGSPIPEPEDHVLSRALVAFANTVDEVATEEDLMALRAWIVRLRLRGESEEYVASTLIVAHDLAVRLGVPTHD